MRPLALLILTLSCAASGEQVPSHFKARCERYLVDHGWVNSPARAQVKDIDGTVQRIDDTISVYLNGFNSPIRYARTERNVTDMIRVDQDFPASFFELENFKDKKVLDLACGEGRAVEQLLRAGVDVVGLDVYLTPYMLSKPYFIKASAHQTGLPAESFDIIYTTQGPFTYLEHNRELMTALMTEAGRLLKVGGVLRISSVTGYGDPEQQTRLKQRGADPAVDLKDTIYTNLPKGLRIKSFPDRWWFVDANPEQSGHAARYWLEIEKFE